MRVPSYTHGLRMGAWALPLEEEEQQAALCAPVRQPSPAWYRRWHRLEGVTIHDPRRGRRGNQVPARLRESPLCRLPGGRVVVRVMVQQAHDALRAMLGR